MVRLKKCWRGQIFKDAWLAVFVCLRQVKNKVKNSCSFCRVKELKELKVKVKVKMDKSNAALFTEGSIGVTFITKDI